jgi:hypothetical protein
MMSTSETTIIIGCGTGRCGTTSLGRLIEGCQDVVCTHERRPLLPWRFNEDLYQDRVRELTSLSASWVGDIAPSYLPYVERFIETIPKIKVICMERDRQGVIESYVAKTPWQHHWYEHDGTEWFKNELWGPTFPKYNIKDKAQAIGMYWDEYHREIRRIAQRYPASVQIFDVDIFNSRDGQTRIFDFLEMPESHRHYPLAHRHNAHPRREETLTPAEVDRWARDLWCCAREIAATVPPGETLILVDQDNFGTLLTAGRRAFPFLEQDGRYWGLPWHSQAAIAELERLRQAGAHFIAFVWPAFWWLDYYTEFEAFLRSSFPCVIQNERLIVFDMQQTANDDTVEDGARSS